MSEQALTLFDNAPTWADGSWAVRPVNHLTAKRWMRRFHYLASAGTALYRFGVFPPESDMIACVVISGSANTHGLGDKFPELADYDGNLEITRVAVHPDAPKNAASRSVALVLAELHYLTGIEWVFSYADTGQGHHGGIYQALNAIYLGKNLGGKPPPRWEMMIDGEWVETHSRNISKVCGTARSGAVDKMAKLGYQVRIIGESSEKHTYLIPCGSPKTRRDIRDALAPYAKPYPKRAEEDSRESRPVTDREGGVRFPDSAPSNLSGPAPNADGRAASRPTSPASPACHTPHTRGTKPSKWRKWKKNDYTRIGFPGSTEGTPLPLPS